MPSCMWPPWPSPTKGHLPSSILTVPTSFIPFWACPHLLLSWHQSHSGCDAGSGTALPGEGLPAWAGVAPSAGGFNCLKHGSAFTCCPPASSCPAVLSQHSPVLFTRVTSTAFSVASHLPAPFPSTLFLPRVSFLGASWLAHLPSQPLPQDCGLPRL